MLPSCELGKISTFILFDDSLASSSANICTARLWICAGGSICPNRSIFADWPIAGAPKPAASAVAAPASYAFRKSRRFMPMFRLACFISILLEFEPHELGQPQRQRREEHHQDDDARHPDDERKYRHGQRLELHVGD